MMYVPGLKLLKLDKAGQQGADPAPANGNIVRMIAEKGVAVGTSSYIISKTGDKKSLFWYWDLPSACPGVDSILAYHATYGYKEAIPNIMSEIFPESRYACYPMVFHRAGPLVQECYSQHTV